MVAQERYKSVVMPCSKVGPVTPISPKMFTRYLWCSCLSRLYGCAELGRSNGTDDIVIAATPIFCSSDVSLFHSPQFWGPSLRSALAAIINDPRIAPGTCWRNAIHGLGRSGGVRAKKGPHPAPDSEETQCEKGADRRAMKLTPAVLCLVLGKTVAQRTGTYG